MIQKIMIRLNGMRSRTKSRLWTRYSKIIFKLWGIDYGKNLNTRGHVLIESRGNITIGDNVTINSAPWSNPIGGAGRTCFQVFPDGEIVIGDDCGLSNCAITARKSVKIGRNVLIGAGCRIYDTDFHPLEYQFRYGAQKNNSYIKSREVVIDDGVFIGGGVIILKGTHIGKNSIIGAGSVVSGVVPDGEIWGGNPAHFIRKIN